MEFSGSQLVTILEQQRPECRVELRADDGHRTRLHPSEAARFVADSGYVGVGHRKCIMYLRPRDWGIWRGCRTTERSRNDAGEFIGPPDTTKKHVGARE